jgi:hypothetical protein
VRSLAQSRGCVPFASRLGLATQLAMTDMTLTSAQDVDKPTGRSQRFFFNRAHKDLTKAMKRAAITLWNVLLLAFVCFWAWAIIPKALLQFTDLDQLRAGTFKARVIMIGFEGLGLFLAIAVCAASVSSFFWRRISGLWRAIFGGVLVVLFFGTITAIGITHADRAKGAPNEFVNLHGDFVAFWVTTAFILLPHVICGRGYPDLAIAACCKIRGVRNTASTSGNSIIAETAKAKRGNPET